MCGRYRPFTVYEIKTVMVSEFLKLICTKHETQMTVLYMSIECEFSPCYKHARSPNEKQCAKKNCFKL